MARLAVGAQAVVLGFTIVLGFLVGPTAWVGWAIGQAAVALGACAWLARRRRTLAAIVPPAVSAVVTAVLLVTGGAWPPGLSLGSRGCSELELALVGELEPATAAPLRWDKPFLGDCTAAFTTDTGATTLAARYQTKFDEHGWGAASEEPSESRHVVAAAKDGFVFELILTDGASGRYRAVLYEQPATGPEAIASSGSDSVSGEPSALTAPMSWQWQLQGDINTSYDVDLYDVDLFEAPSATIEELRADGRIVVCYFSAGSYEDWRDDAADFSPGDLGEPLDGWEGERWVDIRSGSVRAVMTNRLDLAADRGCDGVEPDNAAAFDENTGFDLTADDQLAYNRYIAGQARARGLLVGLKNDLSQIRELVNEYDFAVNEECVEYGECEFFAPFIEAGKPVFGAEYSTAAVADPESTCEVARAAGLSVLILPLELDDSSRVSCTQ